MVEQILDSIAGTLRKSLGQRYTVYDDPAPQNLQEPCLMVNLVTPATKRYPGRRDLRRHLFCVQFLPRPGKDEQAACARMFGRLCEVLEVIRVGGQPIRGTDMRGDTTGEGLSFFVRYDCFTHRPDNTQTMEDLEVTMHAE